MISAEGQMRSGIKNEFLPDLLAPNLQLVFIGTAAGAHSAKVGAYYAKPGNKFWPTLHAVGLTPTLFAPHDFPQLLALGIGLTDLSKTGAGMDHQIAPESFDAPGLRAKLAAFAPRAIAFTSKRGAALYQNRATSDLAYGRQPDEPGAPACFVLPSPSGAAGPHWRIEPWEELGAWFRGAA
jgi:TDG/mug DNA glycosylase family protein